MCIPGHSRDSVCLHCRPAPVARRGARAWNRNGNRCAEPHPAQRPPAMSGTMTALPCRGRGRHGQNRAGAPCPRHTRGSPPPLFAGPGPAPTRCCRRPGQQGAGKTCRRAHPASAAGRSGRPPAPSTAATANPHGLANQETGHRQGRPHAMQAAGCARPGHHRDPAGRHAPPRPPAHCQPPLLGPRHPGDRPGNSQRKTPGFPGVS